MKYLKYLFKMYHILLVASIILPYLYAFIVKMSFKTDELYLHDPKIFNLFLYEMIFYTLSFGLLAIPLGFLSFILFYNYNINIERNRFIAFTFLSVVYLLLIVFDPFKILFWFFD